MGEQEMKKVKKHICVGLLAHVDAGKTTLSEALLYLSGTIRKAGRVDNKDAFLDTYALERARGITIFSKQAVLHRPGMTVTLLDTPGHVDFSAEMERTLQVLNYAILIISGADGVQGHTKTLWRLLKRYQVPTFLFVNKMDQNGTDKGKLLTELKEQLHENCVDFTEEGSDTFYDAIAMCSETALEQYLEHGIVETVEMRRLIRERSLFPCYFGSALKMTGVEEFMQGLDAYTVQPQYPAEFGGKVFKIARDHQGNRLTYLKVTGGSLKVKALLSGQHNKNKSVGSSGEDTRSDFRWEEKVNQIRIYSGDKFETAEEVTVGTVCAVTGLNHTYPGQGLGCEAASEQPVLEPVLTYQMILPEGMDAAIVLLKLRQLEEEEPELHILWNEALKEIQVQLMGEVQIEILTSLLMERFSLDVKFGSGNIVYKETISKVAEGVGHYEPLRHYAEVHLLLEPLEPGSGLVFAADCSEDVLDRNWQRLVLTHLEEKEHIGVLTGAPITDMKITLVTGRAHLKHTEGGDFRQATYRALRQGLMQAESVLLEPYYDFSLEIPENMVGRAMTDVERMHGKLIYMGSNGEQTARDGMHVLTGSAPVATMQNYQKEVIAYTRGQGKLFVTPGGYLPCHNTEEVLEAIGYDPERDIENPTGSVFCTHGAGFVVSWDMVKDYMHLESVLPARENDGNRETKRALQAGRGVPAGWKNEEEDWIGTEEIDRILEQTYNANKKNKSEPSRNNWKLKGRSRQTQTSAPVTRNYEPKQPQIREKEYLLVDGYNIIFAWEELRALAAVNVDGARGRLLDILCNYQAIRKCELIVVFDAYRVAGHQTELLDYHNIHVVYTKEAETADQYIEKFAHENAKRYRVTVATSDGLEQIIIRGAGCGLMSAKELEQEVTERNRQLQEDFAATKEKKKNYLFDGISADVIREAGKQQE